MSDGGTRPEIEPGSFAPPASDVVCWTHPIYDGINETWRPRTRVLTPYATIAAFLAAKQARGGRSRSSTRLRSRPTGATFQSRPCP